MSIILVTSLGNLTVDLRSNSPFARSFLSLCAAKQYNNHLLFNLLPQRFVQTGDPTGTGTGGQSIHGLISRSPSARFLKNDAPPTNQPQPELSLAQPGLLYPTSIDNTPHTNNSQFLITLGSNVESHGLHNYFTNNTTSAPVSFGHVSEDENNVLEKINALYTDRGGRPLQDVRILNTVIVYDPWHELEFASDASCDAMRSIQQPSLLPIEGFKEWYRSQNDRRGCTSPIHPNNRPPAEKLEIRISVNESLDDDEKANDDTQEIEELKTAKSQAIVLEMLGDLPSATMKPKENVLFVCKLNPITSDEDLELIFSRFDPEDCKAHIVRDAKSGASLNFAFVEFGSKEACAQAYFKMNNALIDDRRIKVDFSQSVGGQWQQFEKQKMGGGGGGGGGGGLQKKGGLQQKKASRWDNGGDNRPSKGGLQQRGGSRWDQQQQRQQQQQQQRPQQQQQRPDSRKRTRSKSVSSSSSSSSDSSSKKKKKKSHSKSKSKSKHHKHSKKEKKHKKNTKK